MKSPTCSVSLSTVRNSYKNIDNNVRYWVDVTKIHEMGKTNQEKAPIGTSPAIHACDTRTSTKTGIPR